MRALALLYRSSRHCFREWAAQRFAAVRKSSAAESQADLGFGIWSASRDGGQQILPALLVFSRVPRRVPGERVAAREGPECSGWELFDRGGGGLATGAGGDRLSRSLDAPCCSWVEQPITTVESSYRSLSPIEAPSSEIVPALVQGRLAPACRPVS